LRITHRFGFVGVCCESLKVDGFARVAKADLERIFDGFHISQQGVEPRSF
jgi:hypothetical protein